MTLPGGLLDTPWVVLGWVGALLLLLGGVWSLAINWPQRHWRDEQLMNPWLGSIVALAVLWQLEIRTEQGLLLHQLGSALFTLMFGPARALVGLSLVIVAVTANGHGDWSMLGPNLMANAALPIAIISLWRRSVKRWLPNHPFVFIFGNGFFGAALTFFLTGAGLILLVLAGSVQPIASGRFIDGWLPSVFLLSFSEAWLSGMILTLLVIFRPEWVVSFDRRQQTSKP